MAWPEPVAEWRQGIVRRSRLFLLIGIGILFLFFSVGHLTSTDLPRPTGQLMRDDFLPAYLQPPNSQLGKDLEYHGPSYDDASGLVNHTNAVDCVWEPVHEESTKLIKEIAMPAFPLLSAWLKPEAARYGPALKEIPPTLKEQFLLGGRVRFEVYFFDQAYLGGKAMQSVWTIDDVDEYRDEVKKRRDSFTYDNSPVYEALDRWASVAVKGKRGLVIGSETPWLEGMLLEYGAAHVSTLEFGEIFTTHPQLTTYTPQEFTFKFLQGAITPLFDFAFSYSSLEHDGLGRYGDVLNPLGDLQSMARMLSVVKPGGFMFLGVPCCEDALYWNAHRVYGPIRYSEMFAGWRTLDSSPRRAMEGPRGQKGDWVFQPVWTLQNRLGCKGGTQATDIRKVSEAFQ